MFFIEIMKLIVLIVFSVLATINAEDARVFIILSSAGHTALLPLLYPDNLFSLKILLSFTYMLSSILVLTNQHNKPLLRLYEWLYISPLPFVTIYETVLHKLLLGDRLPFLPLAFTSVYCAIGIMYSWVLYYYMYFQDNICIDDETIKKKPRNRTLKNKQY